MTAYLELDPDDPCQPHYDTPCVRTCRWEPTDHLFLRDVTVNGQDGEQECPCEHHQKGDS